MRHFIKHWYALLKNQFNNHTHILENQPKYMRQIKDTNPRAIDEQNDRNKANMHESKKWLKIVNYSQQTNKEEGKHTTTHGGEDGVKVEMIWRQKNNK